MSMATCNAIFCFLNGQLMNKLKAIEQQAELQVRHLTEMVRQARQRLALTENNFSAVIATMSPLKQQVIICLVYHERMDS